MSSMWEWVSCKVQGCLVTGIGLRVSARKGGKQLGPSWMNWCGAADDLEGRVDPSILLSPSSMARGMYGMDIASVGVW